MVVALAVLAGLPVGLFAQDTANRVARAIDLAAERAVASDSVLAAASKWRAALLRDPGDRYAALGLASLARLTSDTTADAALTPLAGGSDAVARRASLDRAGSAVAAGRRAAGDSMYARAAAVASAAHDSIVEAEAQFGRADVAFAQFAFAAARPFIRPADSVRPPLDAILAATSACVQAALRPSDSALRAATLQAERTGNARLAARCLAPLPSFLFGQGEEDASDHAGAEVIARLRRVRDRDALGVALMFQCYRRLTLLDYDASAAYCGDAVSEGRTSHSPYTVGWAELNLGALSRLLGDAAAARAHNARARAALLAINDQHGLGILRRNNADLALDAGDTAAARAAALEALHAASAGADAGGAWRRLADVALRENRFAEAKRDIDSGVAAAVRGHAEVFVPAAKLAYGTVLLREGRPEDALTWLIPSVYDTGQHVARYLIEEQRVEALLALGRRKEALTEMERTTDELERWRATLSDRELRVLAFQTRPLFGGPSPAIAAVVASAVAQGQSDRAFALAERRRARDLEDQRRRAAVLGGGTQGSIAPSRLTSLTSLAALGREIPDDSTAVIEYVTGPVGAPTTVFVVTRRSTSARIIAPVDSLADDISLFDELVDQRQDSRAVARTVGSRVLGPVVRALSPAIERLVIVPDGLLYRIPFPALRLSNGTYAVDRYAISSVPSATVVADLWSHPPAVRHGPARVLAFGNAIPDPGAGGTAERGTADVSDDERSATPAGSPLVEVLSESPSVASSLPRLEWSGDEARMVAAFGRESVVRVGRDATPAALKEAPLDSFSVVHFATHAVVDEQVPARSALLLSADTRSNGIVDAGSLEGRHIAATLVVLSACRTARGALVEGEGVRGLANPFLGAGAHAVLATQWAIGDRSAVPMVYAIYRGIAAGLPVAEALRRAEAEAVRRGAPVREWAAFALIGDPLARVALETPAPDAIPSWVRVLATVSVPRGR